MKNRIDLFGKKEPVTITQSKQIDRLTLAGFFHSLLDAINIERGGLFTVKKLLIDPGKTSRDYCGQQRFALVNPFKLLLITTTITVLAIQQSNTFDQFLEGFYSGVEMNDKENRVMAVLTFLGNYFNLVLWLFIPIAGALSWLFNRKSGINFAEGLVLQTYLFTLSNVITLVLLLDFIIPTGMAMFILLAAFFFYYIFGYKEFYGKSWLRAFFEQLLIYCLGSIVYYAIIVAIAIFYLKIHTT